MHKNISTGFFLRFKPVRKWEHVNYNIFSLLYTKQRDYAIASTWLQCRVHGIFIVSNTICYEVHQKAQDILDGRKVDPTFYPVIYGAEPDEDWTDPKVWKKANPPLGITVGIDKVEAASESAKQKTPVRRTLSGS